MPFVTQIFKFCDYIKKKFLQCTSESCHLFILYFLARPTQCLISSFDITWHWLSDVHTNVVHLKTNQSHWAILIQSWTESLYTSVVHNVPSNNPTWLLLLCINHNHFNEKYEIFEVVSKVPLMVKDIPIPILSGHCGGDHMILGFTTTCIISDYRH